MTTPLTIYTKIENTLGELLLTSREGKLSGLYFVEQPHAKIAPAWVRQDDAPIFAQTARQLEEYLASERKEFDLPISLTGSPFQMSVWNAIAAIPFGRTVTYGDLALKIGRSLRDARAVGMATGQNPVGWIVPCHRVVGKNGVLTGYAGGIPRKSALLDFEAARWAGREAVLAYGETQPVLALV